MKEKRITVKPWIRLGARKRLSEKLTSGEGIEAGCVKAEEQHV